ncbi:methyl-accepting chemotaxis protein [Massilia sp.]|uniref:methyl-accepting chemotaxis protein n=1 Tax=Massilia sp. TaxID=1882437 RepID=UPI0028A08E79|nr:methyl-accepting chemotaxis protein [Massilia sp.]
MKLANLNIGKRLALGYGVICAMLVLMIVLSNAMLGRVNAGTDEIVNARMPRIDMAVRFQDETNAIAIALRNVMLSRDAADRASQVEAIMASRRAMDGILAELKATLQSEKGRALLTQMEQETATYKTGQDNIVRLVEGGDLEQAQTLMGGEMRPLLLRLKAATGAQAALQKELAAKAAFDAEATYRSTALLMWGLGAAALALAGLVAWRITRSITGPLQRALDVANTVAAGDLTSRIEVTTRDETGQLLAALKTMNASLANTVGTVRVGTDTIAVAASQVAVGAQDLSSRTEQQASALEEAASSMEELTSTVRQNADNARQANVLAEVASTVAARGGDVVKQVVGTMNDINASATRINDIIGVIDGIAFQTNILALNAAVEAARAGEQGRGFAVVASEVRNLAQRSAAAAKEIKTLIGDSTGKVETGSKLVAEAGATMEEIVDSVRRVTDIMAEISAASSEQSAGIEQINQAVTQMDQGTQQNAALVEEAAAAATAMREQSTLLAQAVAVFRIDGAQALAASKASVTPVVKPVAAQTARIAAPAPAAAPRPAAPRAAAPVATATRPASKTAGAGRAAAQVDAGEWEEF